MISFDDLLDLIKTNKSDERALAMLQRLEDARRTYSDFQTEVQKMLEENPDSPEMGKLGMLQHLAKHSLWNAEQMFRIWNESTPMTDLSDPVFDAVFGAYKEIMLGDKV